MPKKRTAVPKATEKKLYQESGSCCVFCPENEVSSLQMHHIDEDPSNHELKNLLLVCANCHTKITGGVISEADVIAKKREVTWMPRQQPAAVSVTITNSSFQGDIAQNMTKISSPKAPKIQHPQGSIGADLTRKGYVDYLITRYFKLREADPSYGRRGNFSHAEIHQTIQREFGHKTFFMPVGQFSRLVEFLKMRIDRTITGKRNSSKGSQNYHSFDDHLKQFGESE